jgi:hypothetical protein
MIVVRLVKRSILCVSGAVLLVALAGVPAASALSPWWHLSSGASPMALQPGVAKNEVQEVTVKATGGSCAGKPGATGCFIVRRVEPGHEAFELVRFDATDEEFQSVLEGMYGTGNVTVTGGPGDAEGTKAYVITFTGELAGQPIAPIVTENKFFSVIEITLEKGKREGSATVLEKTRGRADGQIVVSAANLGDANVDGKTIPVSIADKLPVGLRAVAIQGIADVNSIESPVECSLGSLTCTFAGKLQPYYQIEVLISVVVRAGASSGEVNEVSVSGGGAPSASIGRPVVVGGEGARFGAEDYELTPEEEGGKLDTQAGSHPFQLTTTLTINHTVGLDKGGQVAPRVVALAKDLTFKLPPGLIGNPTPFPRCNLVSFLSNEVARSCSPQTAVGVARVLLNDPISIGTLNVATPLFNIEPSVGEPARFGFRVAGVPVLLETSVRTGGDYGVTVSVDNIPQTVEFVASQVTFWGVPGDPRHDNSRGFGCLERAEETAPHSGGLPCNPLEANHPPPLLALPTLCAGPLQTSVEVDSWQEPYNRLTVAPSESLPSLDGCNRLPFTPSIKLTPDGQAGSTPTGLTVDEHVPQQVDLIPTGLSESAVKGLSVTLPRGVALNPAGADGLQACSLEQVGLQSPGAPSCPDASKIATVKVKTPLLTSALEGDAYLAAQNANPFGSLLAMYIYAEDPLTGIRAKAAGEVLEDPVTGQLTAHFEKNPVFAKDPRYAGEQEAQFLPEVPFEDVELHFFGGDRAPLVTPALCGSYTTTGTFTPWSGTPTTEASSEFQIVSGPHGTPCQNPLPFAPSLTAETTSIQAGGFSPFSMTMSREDGNQSLRAVKLRMPPGLLGTLATVKLCHEPQADLGTCGPESLIGHTVVSVGVGGDPYSVRGGEVFITEGYGGAPYGLSIVNPAKAGPFDLGKVVVRAKIEVDPITAVLTITTDPSGPFAIPHILDGIPLQIQHVNVTIDRPNFTFNPTNCSPLAITGNLLSVEGSSSTVSVPFQVTNCAVLAFKPKLTATTAGKTSRAKGASLSVRLTYPAGPYDANISKVKVDLPKQLPSRLTTLQQACPAATFDANPASCPFASIVGHATASTPVMPVPLTGPAYFVSHGGEQFPELIIVLQGYGATVHLIGSTYIDKAGITSSTFKTIPDVPVGTFELNLPQGKYSALAANGNLCTTKKLVMPTSFVAQNGAVIHTTTPIVPTGCAKKAHKGSRRHKGTTHKRKR